ncbi:MAG: hypothetical protein MJ221_01520 [Bacilli bacterium]|nr:hypothetical protein [Bacilli bacterium]
MAHLLKSFFYKLINDITFRITAIIGVALAILMTILYSVFIKDIMGSGAYMLSFSVNPFQNFGIAIPVNLVIFTTLLFSQGIIRNQIIVGNSKTKVYLSLLIGGVVFTLSLLTIYVGVCVGLSTIIGGFLPSVKGTVIESFVSPTTIVQIIVIAITSNIVIASYSIFIATGIRNSGPCIPLSIVPTILLGVFAMMINLLGSLEGLNIPQWLVMVNKIANPFNITSSISYTATITSGQPQIVIPQEDFVFNLINNIVYIVVFSCFGVISFNKKDIK